MANRLEAVVTADIKQFTRSMSMVGASSTAAAGVAIAAFAAMIGVVVKMSNSTLDAAESFETLRVRLQLLEGDMNRGSKEFDMIRKRAKESSFETDKLIDSYIRLKALAGEDFASKHLENIGYAAKVAGQDMATMSSRVGELKLRIESGLTPGLLKRSLRSFATAFGREGVKAMIDMVDAGASADEIIVKLEKNLQRFGNTARQAIEGSAGGKKAKLGGIIKDMFATGGEGEALDNYKLSIDAITDSLLKLEKTESFKKLSDSMSELWANISLMLKDDAFFKNMQSLVDSLKVIADTFSIILKVVDVAGKINAMLPGGIGGIKAPGEISKGLEKMVDLPSMSGTYGKGAGLGLALNPLAGVMSAAGDVIRVMVVDDQKQNVYGK